MADEGDSPDLLQKPGVSTRVRRLNRKPVLLILSAILVMIASMGVVAVNRGKPANGPSDRQETAASTEGLADQFVADQPFGVIGEKSPSPSRPPPPPPPQNDDGFVSVAALPETETKQEGDQNAPPTVIAVSPPMTELQRQIRQRQVQRLWKRHDQLQKAIEAETRVSFDTGSRTGPESAQTPPSGGSGAAAEIQRTIANAAARLGGAPTSPPGNPNHAAALQQTQQTGPLAHQRVQPKSPYEIKTGTVIPSVMVNGINSDLPGTLIGQVSQHVWDTGTGQHLLIPQGTKLYGTYGSEIEYGQKRVLVAWTRLIFPDASTLELEGMSGADQAGYGGFTDKVDRHLWRIYGTAALNSIIGAGFQLSQGGGGNSDNPSPQQQAAAQIGQELSQVSQELIKKEADVQPTLIIRPGYRFNVMVSKDIGLEPYRFKGVPAAR